MCIRDRAYPEARAILNYDALQLKSFEPGAVIQTSAGLQRLVDPWRRPQHLLATAFSKAATFGDKLKIGSLRGEVTRGGMATAYEWEETPTIDMLRSRGFSVTIIESYSLPFLGGIFLHGQLKTSTRMLAFVFLNFSQGNAALPEK